MQPTQPTSNLINIGVNLTPQGAQVPSIGTLLICGDSNVINGLERFRKYSNLSGVASDFGTVAPEYLAAQLYFNQSPQPADLLIARWLRAASSAQLQGALLTPTQEAISNFNYISNGSFHVTVDGTVKTPASLDFTSSLNLNNVAAVIQTALTGATIIWNGSQFIITSTGTGAGAYAIGSVTFIGNPVANDTLTVEGTLITFVSSSPTGSQVLIGATPQITAANLLAFLQASVDSNIITCSYSLSGLVLSITAKTIGTGGNALTLAKSSSELNISGATLTGGVNPSSVSFATAPGSGTDISALLGLTASQALPLIPGYAAETPIACITTMVDASSDWFSSMFAASTQPSDDQNVAVAGFIEALSFQRSFGVTITNSSVLSSTVTNDLASRLKALGYNQTVYQYSSSSAYAIASFLGRSAAIDFAGNNTVITLMYKQEPGVTAEYLTVSQAATLKNKNCNVFIAYENGTFIIQYGAVASGEFYDTIQDVSWLKAQIQTNVFNLLYTSTTKVPQTDAGLNQVVNAISEACAEGVQNGTIGAGTWNAPGFGSLNEGDYLPTGYYIFAGSLALQSESDRAARIAPSIQVAVKLAGAIQLVNVQLNVNQ